MFLSDWTWGGIGPEMFSWFHILWVVICLIACVSFGIYAKNNKDPKKTDRVILCLDIVLIVSEVIKQLLYHFGYYGYLRIDVLPYSFCSVPMYFALIGALTKNEKVKDVCYKFLAFYGIVGGIGVMIYPASLHTELIYISIQTMLWHSILTVMGVYLIIAKGYGRRFFQELIPPFALLVVCSLIAVGLNEVVYHYYLEPLQTVEKSVDYDPGAYEYYKFGQYDAEDDSLLLLRIKDDKLSLTDDYRERRTW